MTNKPDDDDFNEDDVEDMLRDLGGMDVQYPKGMRNGTFHELEFRMKEHNRKVDAANSRKRFWRILGIILLILGLLSCFWQEILKLLGG